CNRHASSGGNAAWPATGPRRSGLVGAGGRGTSAVPWCSPRRRWACPPGQERRPRMSDPASARGWVLPVLLAVATTTALVLGFLYLARPSPAELGAFRVIVSDDT